jgi:hypothetical protein
MQNHFAQAVLCLVARDEPLNGYCATDRYTVSNGLAIRESAQAIQNFTTQVEQW